MRVSCIVGSDIRVVVKANQARREFEWRCKSTSRAAEPLAVSQHKASVKQTQRNCSKQP